MNSNKNMKKNCIKEIAEIINQINSDEKVYNFLLEILTDSEIETLSKRWCIVKMLFEGKTQREISKELNVSLCKVTRGSKILKNDKSVIKNYLKRRFQNEYINKKHTTR